jgi:hypothetical protein
MVYNGRRVVWSRRNSTGANPTIIGGPKAVATPKGVFNGFGAAYGTGTTDRVDANAILDAPISGSRSVVAHLYANGQGGGGLGRVFQNAVGAGNTGVGDEGLYLVSTGVPGALQFLRECTNVSSGSYITGTAFPTGRWAVFGYSWLFDYPTNTVPFAAIDGVPITANGTGSFPATGTWTAGTSQGMAFGNRPTDSARVWDGMHGPVLIFDGYLTPQEHVLLVANPWQIFAPIARPIFVGTSVTVVSISRPSSDVLTSGWTGVPDNVNLYNNIDESVASDTDFILSPYITGGENTIIGFTPSVSAGTWDVRYRADYLSASSQVRIHLLDNSNVVQGSSSWQTVTGTPILYTASVTTTGTATRVKIEVQ